jgi:hypothetical protein
MQAASCANIGGGCTRKFTPRNYRPSLSLADVCRHSRGFFRLEGTIVPARVLPACDSPVVVTAGTEPEDIVGVDVEKDSQKVLQSRRPGRRRPGLRMELITAIASVH